MVVSIFEDDKYEILFVGKDKIYNSQELFEILDHVVPFSIETAGINESVRSMDAAHSLGLDGPQPHLHVTREELVVQSQ